MIHLKNALSKQLEKNEKIKKQNLELVQQLERLKNDPEVMESKARGELGMVKKGERFYRVIK